jgi:hypothetical protein
MWSGLPVAPDAVLVCLAEGLDQRSMEDLDMVMAMPNCELSLC